MGRKLIRWIYLAIPGIIERTCYGEHLKALQLRDLNYCGHSKAEATTAAACHAMYHTLCSFPLRMAHESIHACIPN